MECGVKNGDVRDRGELLHRSSNAGQVGRIVEGSQLAAIVDSLDDLRVDLHAVVKLLTAVHNSVAHPNDFQAAHLMENFIKYLAMTRVGKRCFMALAAGEFCLHPGIGRAQPFSQSLDLRFSVLGIDD